MRSLLSFFVLLLAFSIITQTVEAQYDGGYISDGGYAGGDGGYASDGGYGGGDGSYNQDGSYGASDSGPYHVTGFVYIDNNTNSIHDDADTPLSGQVIQLWDAPNTTMVNQSVTDATGHYDVADSRPGNYYVRHINGIAPGYVRGTPAGYDYFVQFQYNKHLLRNFSVLADNTRSFAQNPPQPFCDGTIPGFMLTWGASASTSRYDIWIMNVTTGATSKVGETTNLYYPLEQPILTPGVEYGFIIQAIGSWTVNSDNMWSHQKYPTPDSILPSNCATQTGLPIITLTLTRANPPASQTNGGLPLTVDQNQTGVTLSWTITNSVGSATASVKTNDGTTVPAAMNTVWNGSKGTSGTSGSIPTNTPGTYIFSLLASNGAGGKAESIQLNILQFPRPYIQTTGGDIHSNETIYITP